MVRQLTILMSAGLLLLLPAGASTHDVTSVSRNAKEPKQPRPPKGTRPTRHPKPTPPVSSAVSFVDQPFYCDGPSQPSSGLYSSASLINIPGVKGKFVNSFVDVPAGISIPVGPSAGTTISIWAATPTETVPFNSLTIDVQSSSDQNFFVWVEGQSIYGGPSGVIFRPGSQGLTITPSTNSALAAAGFETWTMTNTNSFYAPLSSLNWISISQKLSYTTGASGGPVVNGSQSASAIFGNVTINGELLTPTSTPASDCPVAP